MILKLRLAKSQSDYEDGQKIIACETMKQTVLVMRFVCLTPSATFLLPKNGLASVGSLVLFVCAYACLTLSHPRVTNEYENERKLPNFIL